VALEAVRLRLGMSLVAYGTVDLPEVRLMGVAVGEILRFGLLSQLLHGTVAFEAPGILHGVPLFGHGATMASTADDVCLRVKRVGVSGALPGGKNLFHPLQLILRRGTEGYLLTLQAEALAGLPGVATHAVDFTALPDVGTVETC